LESITKVDEMDFVGCVDRIAQRQDTGQHLLDQILGQACPFFRVSIYPRSFTHCQIALS